MLKKVFLLIALILTLTAVLVGCLQLVPRSEPTVSSADIPAYNGQPYVALDGNVPDFTDEDKAAEPYEFYADLDALNRCTYAVACIDRSLMPTEERGSIGQVKPSGWHTVKYDIVDGKYLYNRCHLIGFQLTGENANPENLITGTRYLNIEGMLPFENMIADYIKETGNRVLYRVTPDFRGQEAVARGVLLEGWSVEDQGQGICFKVYAYNVQPGITIDYCTGESGLDEEPQIESGGSSVEYILNTSSMKFHTADCGQGKNVKAENKEVSYLTREALLLLGYSPAGCCEP